MTLSEWLYRTVCLSVGSFTVSGAWERAENTCLRSRIYWILQDVLDDNILFILKIIPILKILLQTFGGSFMASGVVSPSDASPIPPPDFV
jgi:hypothetical protein